MLHAATAPERAPGADVSRGAFYASLQRGQRVGATPHFVGQYRLLSPIVRPDVQATPHHDHHTHHETPSKGSPGQNHSAHVHMVDEFRRRFWISLGLTLPVLAFAADRYVAFAFASAVYFYGGWPFLTGLVDELRRTLPGMMTLVGLAIT